MPEITRCPYAPFNGQPCPESGTVALDAPAHDERIMVCAEHLPRYLNNGWARAPEITRSTGIVPGFPYMGPLPGGGYRGLTEELDVAVAQAAELLRTEYGRDVEIRYNSDRQSGGAFVVDDLPPGWDHKCVVGICADLRHLRPEGMTADEELRAHPDNGEYHRWIDSLPRHLVISTNVRAFTLRDPSIANRQTYAYIDHPTLDAALAWLRENVREGAFDA